MIPAICDLKMRIWGHEGIVLHSSEIRRCEGPFAKLQLPEVREEFMESLAELIRRLPFRIFVVVIDKRRWSEDPGESIYTRALSDSLKLMRENGMGDDGEPWGMLAESRGWREDKALEEAYQALSGWTLPKDLENRPQLGFAAKSGNVVGLQLADLCARPFGRKVIRPDKNDRTFDLLQEKMREGGGAWRIIGE